MSVKSVALRLVGWVVATCRMPLLLAAIAMGVVDGVSAQTCRPDCRVGYVCIDGTCLSACNPLCAAGEYCTVETTCEPRAIGQVPEAESEVALVDRDPSTWSLHAGLGHVSWRVHTGDGDLDSASGAVRMGAGIQTGIGRGLRLRGNLTGVLSVSLPGLGQASRAIFVDGMFQVGPMTRKWPWLFAIGPVVGYGAVDGFYPPRDVDYTPAPRDEGSANLMVAGGKFETGFAFGEGYPFEINADVWLATRLGDYGPFTLLWFGGNAAFHL